MPKHPVDPASTCIFRSCRPTHAAVLLALLPALLLTGCAYSDKPLYRADIDTVVVPVFTSRAVTYPGVEFRLTEAVKKKIERQTPFKVTDSRAADTILEGQITDIRQHTLSRTRDVGTARETEIEITVSFEWKDRRTGDVLRRRDGLVQVGRYAPTIQTRQTLEFGLDHAVDRMADAIVSLMREDWNLR